MSVSPSEHALPRDQLATALYFKLITPSNTEVLNPVPRALLILDGGAVRLEDHAGNIVDCPAVPAYGELKLRPKRVHADGTAAALILALY